MAAVAGSYIRITYVDDVSASHDLDFRQPLFGYETTILLSVDMARNDTGRLSVFDSGGGTQTLDIRQCACTILMDATEMAAFNAAFKDDSTKGRARNVVISMYAGGSGFRPFGPDQSDKGPFTVTMEVLEEPAAMARPYKCFAVKLLLTNVGAYPAFIPPTATEGAASPVTIGSVTGVRYPAGWFAAKLSTAQAALSTPGATAYWRDRGPGADRYETSATFKLSIGKAAAVINQLVSTTRAASFTLAVPAGSLPFGASKSSPHTVMLAQDAIKMTHDRWNEINMPLTFALV